MKLIPAAAVAAADATVDDINDGDVVESDVKTDVVDNNADEGVSAGDADPAARYVYDISGTYRLSTANAAAEADVEP
jgi:hypothetical protein